MGLTKHVSGWRAIFAATRTHAGGFRQRKEPPLRTARLLLGLDWLDALRCPTLSPGEGEQAEGTDAEDGEGGWLGNPAGGVTCHADPDEILHIRRGVDGPLGRGQAGAVEGPTPALYKPKFNGVDVPVCLIPLEDVAAHVVGAVGTGGRRKHADRRQAVRTIGEIAGAYRTEVVGVVRTSGRYALLGRLLLCVGYVQYVPFLGL